MVVYQSNQDVEQPMTDLYMDDQHSTGTSLGPSPEDLEAVFNRTEHKRMRNNKILFGLGIFVILMASIPILLFALDEFKLSSSSSASHVAITNDICLEAIGLDSTGDSYSATTAGAKHDENADFENCGVDVGPESGPGVWFSVTGSGGPIRVIKQEENAFTNQISVYQGHCGELKCVTGDNLKGTVLWNAQKGKTYFIRISGVNGHVGNFNIVLQDLSDERTPEDMVRNDNCEQSMGLSSDGSISLGTTDTAMFNLEGAGSCYRTMNAGRGVWYDVFGTGQSLVATTNSSDTQLAIFTGNCDNLECITASDLASGVASYVQWHSELRERYFILAHSVGGGKGSPFEISIGNDNPEDEDFVINDFCKGAIGPVSSDGSVQRGSTTFATLDRDGSGSCYPETLEGDGVWFSLKGTGESLKVYPSMDSGIEPLVSVFEGSCRKLECVDGTRHDIDDEDRKVVTWRSSEDSTYYLLVRGVDTKGSFEIIIESFEEETEEPEEEPAPTGSPTVTAVPQERPTNGYCDTAAEIPALGFAMSGSTENAGPYLDIFGACSSEPNKGPAVWYRVIGDGKTLNAHTAETSELDAFITVYAGDCEALVCVPDVYGDTRTKRSYNWETTAGVVYYLLVQGHSEDQKGQFEIVVGEISPAPATGPTVAPSTVANDHCDGAMGPIPADGSVLTGSNEGATVDMEGVGSCYQANATGVGVWYSIIGTGETLEILSKGLTGLEFSVTLFDGFDCDTLSCVKSDYVPANKAGVLAWDSIQNVPYYVLVHGVDAAEGSFELMVLPTRAEGVAPGASDEQDTGGSVEIEIIIENDGCNGAIGPLSSSTEEKLAATMEVASAWEYAQEGACSTSGASGIWYAVAGSGNVVKASVDDIPDGTTPDISIFSGACNDISCVDSTLHRSSKTVSWYAESDQVYFVVVHSPSDSTASFELTLKPVETPANNDCDASLPALVPGNTFITGTTEGATVDADVGNCHEEANSPGVWYRLQGTGNTMTLVQNNTHDHEAMISIFSGGCDSLLCRNGFNSLLPQRGPVSWTTEEGENYFLHFHSHSGTGGQFEFKLEEQEASTTEPPTPTQGPNGGDVESKPANDICQDALGPLPLGSRSDGRFGAATADSVGMCGTATNSDPGVWFTVNGTGAGIRISTCKAFVAGFHEVSSSPVSVSVFRQGCDDLQCHVGSNDTCSGGGVVNWNTEEGELYHVLITGDEAARKEDYILLHDHTQWIAQHCVGQSTEFVEQLNALKHFFDSTGNTRQSGSLLEKGWLSGCDVCNKWGGLECNNNEEVTRIRLGEQTPALSGTIPSVLHRGFKKLVELELRDNSLQGTIPDLSGVDRTLQTLNLRGNNLTGSLPEKFTELNNLVFLNLSFNQLTGELPNEIADMKSLKHLSLANNTFGGTIPPGVGSLNDLEILQLQDNNFTSTIPTELGLLTNLQTLELHHNNFRGPMPAQICQLRYTGALKSLTADCSGVEPAVYCSSDCCTACR